jgi:hypothetical protein
MLSHQDYNSLTKVKVIKDVGIIILSYENSGLEENIKKLQALLKKAKKEGFTDVSIHVGLDEGDECNMAYEFIKVSGSIEETDEDWHRRLEELKRRAKRTLEDARWVVNATHVYSNVIASVNKALRKSSLK